MEQDNTIQPPATAAAARVTPNPGAARRRTRAPGWFGSLLRNRKARLGLLILGFFVLTAIFAPLITPLDPNRMVGRPHQAPSAEHPLGTSRQGQDIFTQVVYGARTTLVVGFTAGTVII